MGVALRREGFLSQSASQQAHDARASLPFTDRIGILPVNVLLAQQTSALAGSATAGRAHRLVVLGENLWRQGRAYAHVLDCADTVLARAGDRARRKYPSRLWLKSGDVDGCGVGGGFGSGGNNSAVFTWPVERVIAINFWTQVSTQCASSLDNVRF